VKKFSFKLESVRVLRGHSESVAKETLARELAAGTQREAELRGADAALASALASATTLGETAAQRLLAQQTYVERLERRRLVARGAAAAQRQVVEVRRIELETAAAARAAVDRLRERSLAAFVVEEERLETALLGELATSRAARTERRA
jgi:flagellar export protein FliJ